MALGAFQGSAAAAAERWRRRRHWAAGRSLPIQQDSCSLVCHACRKWAFAGRSRDKLQRLAASLTGHSSPGIIVADVSDPASLLELAK